MKRICKIIIGIAAVIVALSITSTACLAYSIESSGDTQYKLDIVDENNNTISINQSDIDLRIRFNNVTDGLFSDDTKIKIVKSLRNYNIWIGYDIAYDEDKLSSLIENTELFNSDRINPENAYISIDRENGAVSIIESKNGTVIDSEKLLDKLDTALINLNSTFNIADEAVYREPDITSTDLQSEYKEIQDLTSFTITYSYNGKDYKFNQSYMLKYIEKDDTGKWIIPEVALDNFISTMTNELDTYGKSIDFVTTDGRNITVPGGNWGWKVDKVFTKNSLSELIAARTDAAGEIAWAYTAPLMGDKEFVNYVEIDMGKQHLYLYTNNQLVGDWDIVSGMANDPGRRTPEGVFRLTYKTKNAVLRGPTWESPVKYWMPFNGGIGMHDASWQSSFGGNAYYYRGSHGCINMPLAGAKAVYDVIDKTYAIICFY